MLYPLGAFPFPDGDDWATPMQAQEEPQPQQRRPSWKPAASSQEPKRAPIADYGGWAQRKKPSQHVLELPSEFMIPPPNQSACGMNYFCAPPQRQSSLVSTTAQTDEQGQQPQQGGPMQQQHHQPMIMSPCCCGQCYGGEQWQQQGGIEQQSGVMQPMGRPEVQQRKYSLPPASHHSPEQRTSYRAHRFY